ncbi:glycosyl hydrolase family 76 [Clostridium acetireducens DSM 10703]|uniref:Glycosyl hydrolase family 76 n=1 Tax=Clostridium acetireducens DSM 10703 TaxID=1121290 RepID=A0A1E8EYP4_9CLOT|nr:thioredoxin domain-containing protein [Clostridium acetireducens]OFI06103.1 glycosyl hydrolase family 76 [Clostridium acetireducens DSM 10703]
MSTLKTLYKKANKLINEKSPYLLQHAYNPVDWYPWGEEAFEIAKEENKLVFLSIGYSTCHWCHVMERESFEDEEIAKILNKYFVSIKVDREERPDIDNIYMTFCQMYSGSGGWPLTVIMTHDKKPFFVGTYFPKEDRYGRRGLKDILNSIKDSWIKDKENILILSNNIAEGISKFGISKNQGKINKDIVNITFKDLKQSFDKKYGGFSIQPKFPLSHNISFLLKYYFITGENLALYMAEKTLQSMYKGGIFDHIGYGFSRYSTDEKWLAPHFEKMLYDNALLITPYTEAYAITKNVFYKDVVDKIVKYLVKNMLDKEGGFYSAEDADSEGVEGKFYLWSRDEIIKILGEEKGEVYCRYYDVTENGNFEHKNIPNLIKTDINFIEKDNNLKNLLEQCRNKLFSIREKRIHPHKDDKILTSWNGMIIASLAYAGRVLNNYNYIKIAENVWNFISNKLISKEDNRLFGVYRKGESYNLAFLDDYAFTIGGLIELYQSTFKLYYLKKAIELNNNMLNLFWDNDNGGLYFYGEDSEKLIARNKESYDGAIPSGNSVAALNMVNLSKFTNDLDLEDKINKQFFAFGEEINKNPLGYSNFVIAFMSYYESIKQIVITGNKEDADTKAILEKVNSKYNPFSIIILNDESSELFKVNSFLKEQKKVNNKTTIYICENFSCKSPVNNIDELDKLLG